MSTMQFVARNSALDINPPNADVNLTRKASDWLWAVTAVYAVAFLAFLAWTIALSVRPASTTVSKAQYAGAPSNVTVRPERIFHFLFTIAAFVGFIGYFTMASDLGNTPVRQFMHNDFAGQTRQFYYARYIMWFVAWPLVLTALLLVSGLSWATILFSIGLLWIWIVSWLSGGLVASTYRWGYYTWGTVSLLVLLYIILAWGVSGARTLGTSKSYTMLAVLLSILWIIYPIAWAVSEGSNRITLTGEMVFYGILDFFVIPIYGLIFLIESRRFDNAELYAFSQYGRVTGREAVNYPQTGNVGEEAPRGAPQHTGGVHGENVESGVTA